jgi:hypothetical protein
MGITLREASEKVGVTRQTLMKAIKTGRVSAEKADNGEWRIEPVELFRVWPPVNEVQHPLQDGLTSSDTPGLQAENRLLREQVAELREERNAWREQAQRLALTDQRTPLNLLPSADSGHVCSAARATALAARNKRWMLQPALYGHNNRPLLTRSRWRPSTM